MRGVYFGTLGLSSVAMERKKIKSLQRRKSKNIIQRTPATVRGHYTSKVKSRMQARRVSTWPIIWKSGGLKLPVGRHALGQGGAARFFPRLDCKSGSLGFARDDKF